MARVNTVKSFRGTSKTEDGNLHCGRCGDTIRKGDSYRHWSNRTPGMRGGMRSVRCMKPSCTPRPSEYATTSPHLSGLYRAEEDAQDALEAISYGDDGTDLFAEVQQVVTTAAEDIREVANGYAESAQNIEDGFGHATYQSEELEGKSEALNDQADELDSTGFSEEAPPDREDGESDEDYAQRVDAWLDQVKEEAQEAVTAAAEAP